MAVIQISKIQVRRGLEDDLPQLAAGELGWATDTRKLYIGNGVTGAPDYAPEVGNTEILTIYAADALEVRVDALEANVANVQANISSIQSTLTGLSAQTTTLLGNVWVANIDPITTISSLSSLTIDYSLTRGTASRVGTINVTQYNGTATYDDSYSETANPSVSLILKANTANVANVDLTYTTSNTAPVSNATFKYYIRSFA